MPLMDYGRWDAFLVVIEKASTALSFIQGIPSAGQNFRQVEKVAGSRGPSGVDYRLSRFAAYLVAMAGDDTKKAVAEARIYFAVKTREAEAAPQRTALPSKRELAQWVIEAEERAELAEARAAELEPAARSWTT